MMLWMLAGCLVDRALYEERYLALSDVDQDGVLDLYVPRPRAGDPEARTFPCLVFAHGGTWTVGRRDSRHRGRL